MKSKSEQNRDLLYQCGAKGRCFTVKFIKKNGELRVMNCVLKSEKHLKGGILNYDPKKVGTQIVFDLQRRAYRSITLDKILEVKGMKKVFKMI